MFRAERPQAGRFREFWQIGAEYFGNATAAADAEMLILLQTLFRELGLSDARLKINSLGDAKCRPQYLAALTQHIQSIRSTLCEDCQRRADKNPLRVLDCKIDGSKLADVPTIDTFWCDDCRTHFSKVQSLLTQAGGTFEVVPRLVRGLDYYSRTVFEITSSALGAQDALAAGGRYDKLVKDLDGPDIPAIGFAMGAERVLLAIDAVEKGIEKSINSLYIFVAALGEPAGVAAFKLLQELRLNPELAKMKMVIEGGFFEKKLGNQLTIADRLGASHSLILGDEEIQNGEVTVRTMKTGAQEKISLSSLANHLQHLRRA